MLYILNNKNIKMNFCTLTDKNYLLKGLTMRKSLMNTIKKDFILHWLCLDEETHQKLTKLNLNNVIFYKLSELENNDIKLRKAKNNPPSKYGNQYENYCWTLTPYFINYILTNKIKVNEKLMYIDADIYFYHTPEIIFNIVSTKSVGIHSHRFSGNFNINIESGWFNVGVMIFTNDGLGVEISTKWKNWLLNTENIYYNKYGSCGDQKYLELFIELWDVDKVCIFDNDVRCGHLAPWNCGNVNHTKKHEINHKGVIQPVIFFHFSHFVFKETSYSDSIKGEWKPTRETKITEYYNDYFNEMVKINKTI